MRRPLIATEFGAATATLGTETFRHSVKHDCYAGKDDRMYPDAEALSPTYSARLFAYALLHFNNGFEDAYAWELGDVSGIGHADVGCFGLYDRVGAAKPTGKALLMLLRGLGSIPRLVRRTWADGQKGVVTAGFVSASGSGSRGSGSGSGGGSSRLLTVAVVNTGLENATQSVNVVLQHAEANGSDGGGSTDRSAPAAVSPAAAFTLRSADALNCNATAVVKAVVTVAAAERGGTAAGTGRAMATISLELPPSCMVVLTASL